jgi:trans-aconitate 2-methyltransferase
MSKKVSNFYNNYSDRQINAGIHHRHLAIQGWLEKFNMSKSGNVLEIGCGIGTQTQLILEYINLDTKLTAIDISDKNIEIAQKRLSNYKNLKLITADIIELDFSDKYETIILPDVIEHIPLEQHNDLFLKLSRIISETGFILIHIPHPNYLEWVKDNKPEDLQVIDNSVYTNKLLNNVYPHDLELYFLESYSIFNIPADYQVIILKKKNLYNYKPLLNPKGDTLVKRISRKINRFKRRY